MNLSLVEKVFREAEEFNLMQPLGFCGLGEPLEHPHAKVAFEIAAASTAPWTLSTNCEGLDELTIKALARTQPIRTVLSFDAMSREVLAQIRPGLSFDLVWERVHNYIEAMRHLDWKRETYLQMICFPVNQHEVVRFLAHFRKVTRGLANVTLYVKQACFMPGAEMPPELFPSPVIKIPERLLTDDDQLHIQVDDFSNEWKIQAGGTVPCGLPWQFAVVRASGDLSLCCMDSTGTMSVGNIRNRSIREVFASPEATAIRQTLFEHRFSELPLCELCLKKRDS